MFTFLANLKPYTVEPGLPVRRFAGYLLSVDYYRQNAELAARVVRDRYLLAADNGNFDRLSALQVDYCVEAERLDARRRREEHTLGRYARPGELSADLTSAYRDLGDRIAARARDATSDAQIREVVATQDRMEASYLIGMEDFTLALLTGLGLERAYLDRPLAWYGGAAERAASYAVDTRAGAFGRCRPLVFAGMHAMDLDTARAAGAIAGDAGVDGIAAGLGSALADPSYIDHRVIDGRVQELGGGIPRPYLRVAEIAAGLFLGYASRTGRRPRFHALGVGTPILLPLLAVLGDRTTFLATDSTAPIKDAASSKTTVVYVDRPAPMKLKAYLVAERWLDGGPGWSCHCPYCLAFRKQHPFQFDTARAWWVSEGKRSLTAADLWAPGPLAELLPLLAMPESATVRKAAAAARTGHNHWILQRLQQEIRKYSRSAAELRDWAAGIVDAYVAASSSSAWKIATREAWNVVEAASRELEGAAPGGRVSARAPDKR